ncbi:NYN domain-containing protein [Belnapia rosea]|uniref:NYN domain-containing protein n=1 Tax=Belnapia rosea TaxID=938405 RepID=UPI00088D507B|nr:NYN domain-containing protein [Belnapia rosea]SDB71848.1 NYN domain-containing protein [Belnapia rosea]
MTEPRRAALYVDFDNVFAGLAAIDEWAAWNFATHPARWLNWLAEAAPGGPRRLLVRRCYLNPAGWSEPDPGGDLATWLGRPRLYYSRFRPDFVRAGFSVVDCPRLARLKNAADIVMALDILDALAHPTRFEEMVILSGDSDFTPLLHRLREHDRRILVIAPDSATAALRAAADRTIPLTDFATACLPPAEAEADTAPDAGSGPGSGPAPMQEPAATAGDAVADPVEPSAQRDAILDALRRLVAASATPLHLPALGKRIHHELGGWVRRSRFGGAGTLARLIEGTEDLVLEAGPGGGWLYDPRRHAPPSFSQPDLPPDPEPEPGAPPELRAALGEGLDLPPLGAEALEFLLRHLARLLPLPGPPGAEARAALLAEAEAAGFDLPARAVDQLVQWLVRARVDWQPAAAPEDSAARLARALYAELTRQAAAAGTRLPPATLAALRGWVGLAPARPAEEP